MVSSFLSSDALPASAPLGRTKDVHRNVRLMVKLPGAEWLFRHRCCANVRRMFADLCIYTMRHSKSLASDARTGVGELVENRKWVTGSKIVTEASAKGEKVAIVFSAADIESGLIWWATIDSVEILENEGHHQTRCHYSRLEPIEPPRRLSQLRLSTGRPLSDRHSPVRHLSDAGIRGLMEALQNGDLDAATVGRVH